MFFSVIKFVKRFLTKFMTKNNMIHRDTWKNQSKCKNKMDKKRYLCVPHPKKVDKKLFCRETSVK